MLPYCLVPDLLPRTWITPLVKPSGHCSPIADHARLSEYSSALPSIYLFASCLSLPVCLNLPLNKACTWIRTPLVSSAPLQNTWPQEDPVFQGTLARYGSIRPAARPETREFSYWGVCHSILCDIWQGTFWWGFFKINVLFRTKWAMEPT